ncbi:hypothetical protein EV368DRAFT_86914 [Lentinula lateritia]|uniref:Uncharacterized protein n=1 Tax=Lentinula aff. lateritia TaxID=2804960 RepID=A0ACC1TNY8_9AGAR|nr:hypothetical protein F5876DRAFT_80645 [Lentinula aff. lateritia]KAJ3848179.1 hypothetical protein EV368DRAFT_86914 [Lentinula lateritia]
MHYSQLIEVFICVVSVLHVSASPVPVSDKLDTGSSPELGKRAKIQLFHITNAAAVNSIKEGGAKLQVKPTIGDDFNPIGTGGFYVTDNKEEIIEWCKGRNAGGDRAKTNCAELITFEFDDSALSSLKVHKFAVPASSARKDIATWMGTPDFEQWHEYTSLCTHGEQNDEDFKLAADLANSGQDLDLVIGPMVSSEWVRQYAFRTTKALAHLKFVSAAASGV